MQAQLSGLPAYLEAIHIRFTNTSGGCLFWRNISTSCTFLVMIRPGNALCGVCLHTIEVFALIHATNKYFKNVLCVAFGMCSRGSRGRDLPLSPNMGSRKGPTRGQEKGSTRAQGEGSTKAQGKGETRVKGNGQTGALRRKRRLRNRIQKGCRRCDSTWSQSAQPVSGRLVRKPGANRYGAQVCGATRRHGFD